MTALSLDLCGHLDHLLSLFYAFARSETAKAFPPEKEEEYKRVMADGEVKVRDLEAQVKTLRDKLVTQSTMAQLHTQSQQIQPPAARVVTQSSFNLQDK